MRVGTGFRLASAVSAAGIAAVVMSPLSTAQVTGPCSATINGASIANHSTGATGSAIVVPQHSTADVSMSASRAITHLKVSVAFAGFSWTVYDEASTGNSWQRSVKVDNYAKYGVGLYEVSGVSTGTRLSCTGSALVKVSGSALSSDAGKAGLAATVLGAAGVFGSAFFRPRLRPRFSIVSVLGGLLAGVGAGVLLQEFAILYPTRPVALAELGVGVVTGIGLPSLARLLPLR